MFHSSIFEYKLNELKKETEEGTRRVSMWIRLRLNLREGVRNDILGLAAGII
ncbi:Bgt-20897 [Blumeria graminis f. sp. tritici]|uniref:Bgt-20897 n=2 Tax=Blumeria graminis f. sp. tritici TaxID=62690 RepID=A0A381KZT1_BLUGR|nr:Bgt-20897 [Blumeria graminis f. sp. tritici]